MCCAGCLQGQQSGPWAAYVDDAASLKTQLQHIFPSLQHILADITHVMRRFSETLTPKHCKIGGCASNQTWYMASKKHTLLR